MPNATSVLRRALIVVAATGMLSSTGAVLAGGSGQAGASPVALGPKAQIHFEKHFDCANAPRRLGHLQRVEARFAKRLAHANKAEAKATAAGRPKLATHWRLFIAHELKAEARATGPKARATAAQEDAMIMAKCHVAAPSSSSPLSTVTS